MNVPRSRLHLKSWIDGERSYGDAKYPDKSANDQRSPEDWLQFVNMYLNRAMILGISTPQGRRALGKALVTLMDWLETEIRRNGLMPTPGTPS